MKTIIQDFPTIYGEIVNGSVFGQPNGSIARPPQNAPASVTVTGDSGTLTFSRNIPGGSLVAYTIAGVTVSIVTGVYVIGEYVVKNADEDTVATGGYPGTELRGPGTEKPTDGDSLTLTVRIKDAYGNVLATSSGLTISAVVPE